MSLYLSAAEVEKVVKAAKKVAEERNEPISATALQYVLADQAVASAVVGIRTQEQLLEAISGANANPLLLEQLSVLQTAVTSLKYEQHR